MTERIAFLKSQTTLPVEVEISQKSGNRGNRKQPSKKVLDLVPYLENLETDGNGSISFTLRRLPAQRSEAVSGISQGKSGSYENESQNVIQQAEIGASNGADVENDRGLVSVKPSWVLGLIHPNAKWSLIRTEIQMEPLKDTFSVS
jgi:hypothetical protein